MRRKIEFLIERYLDSQNLDEIGDEDIIREQIDVPSLASEIFNFLYQESLSFRPSYKFVKGNYLNKCEQCEIPFGSFESKTGAQSSFQNLLMKEILFLE